MSEAAIQARMSASTISSNQLQQRSNSHPQSGQLGSQQRTMAYPPSGDVQVVLSPRVPALHVQHRLKTLRARLSFLGSQWGAICRLLFTAFPFFGVLMLLDLLLAIGSFIAAIVPATLNYYANTGGFVLILVSALSAIYAFFFNVAFHYDWERSREYALLVGSRKSSSRSAGASGGEDEDVAGKMLQVHVSLMFHGLLQLTASLTTCLVAALFARTNVSSTGWDNNTSSSLIACAAIGFVHLVLNIGELVWLAVLVLRGIRWY